MNILITGGAGYLGSVLVPMLLQSDMLTPERVVVVDSFKHNVPSLANFIIDRRLTIINGNVNHDSLMQPRLQSDFFDVIVHLAALVGAPSCDASPKEATATNLHATTKLAEGLSPHAVLIFPCTNSGYGKGGRAPLHRSRPDAPAFPLRRPEDPS